MKTGIYGGTFNPIHRGHLHILTEFYRRLGLDRVLVIPTRIPPHKRAGNLASAEDRLEMCRLAVGEIPIRAEVSDLEVRRKEKSYTADTLLELRGLYPGDSLYLLMGEDMFLTVQNWYAPEVIFENAVICAAPRSREGHEALLRHARKLADQFPEFRYAVEDIPYLPVSSTRIRESGALDEVPESVAEYIRKRGLYGAEKGDRS